MNLTSALANQPQWFTCLIARGNGNYGGATEWVERDTHMHIETVADAIRGRLNELGVLEKLEFAQPDKVPLEQQDLLTSL
jgi:hypothetical protein